MLNNTKTQNRKLFDSNGVQTQARNLLDRLVSSVQVLVDDITALEVNTMIVEEINGSKFNAWQAYQEIYSINDKDYFREKNIPEIGIHGEKLHERYKNLFTQLEREYFYLLLDANSNLYQPQNEKVIRYQERLKLLKEKKQGEIVEDDPKYIKLAEPILPAIVPALEKGNQADWQYDSQEIQKLLNNGKFIRTLRKVIELKAALDSSDVQKSTIDVIYAQTVMQLDGDIISRYHKDLFNLPDDEKNLIIKIHTEGVVSGEKQWHGILDFLISLVRNIANSSLSRNGR